MVCAVGRNTFWRKAVLNGVDAVTNNPLVHNLGVFAPLLEIFHLSSVICHFRRFEHVHSYVAYAL
jgi:hypothetical protein